MLKAVTTRFLSVVVRVAADSMVKCDPPLSRLVGEPLEPVVTDCDNVTPLAACTTMPFVNAEAAPTNSTCAAAFVAAKYKYPRLLGAFVVVTPFTYRLPEFELPSVRPIRV